MIKKAFYRWCVAMALVAVSGLDMAQACYSVYSDCTNCGATVCWNNGYGCGQDSISYIADDSWAQCVLGGGDCLYCISQSGPYYYCQLTQINVQYRCTEYDTSYSYASGYVCCSF